MNRQWILILSFLGILGLCLLTYWLGVGGNYNELLKNVAYVAAPTFAVFGGVYAIRVHGFGGSTSRPLIFLTLGLLMWAIGEWLWVYYDFIKEVSPYPSVADLFYLLAYPLIIAGLVEQIFVSKVNWARFNQITLFLFGVIAVMMLGAGTYFGIFLSFNTTASLLESVVALAYGLADVIIILCSLIVLILAWEFKGGSLMKFYLYCFVAFSFTLMADIGFAAFNSDYLAGVAWIKNILDTLWILQYLYFGVAFGVFGLSLKSVQERLTKHK
jgi:hypothetical protein